MKRPGLVIAGFGIIWLCLGGLSCSNHGQLREALTDQNPRAGQPSVRSAPLAEPAGLSAVSLPSPSELATPLALRDTSYVEADLVKSGVQFEPDLAQRVSADNAPDATFEPIYDPLSNDLGSLAYAGYRFVAPGYDRSGQVRLVGQDLTASSGLYVGLSNWNLDRWDWFKPQGSAPLRVNVPSLSPYFRPGGELFAIVLTADGIEHSLTSISLGGVPPTAVLEAGPLDGQPPLSVTFDASGSAVGEGTFTDFSWDIDGDGIFETSTGTVPQLIHEYEQQGTYTPALRVSNSGGESAVASQTVHVASYWLHYLDSSASTTYVEQFNSLALDAQGNIYAAGLGNGGSDAYTYQLFKLDRFGELLWAREFTSGQSGLVDQIALDSQGNLLLTGSMAVTGKGSEAVVQKWDPDGGLIWSRSFGSSNTDSLQQMVVDGLDIFVAGYTKPSEYDLIIARLDSSGNLLWTRSCDGQDLDFSRGLTVRRSFLGDLQGASIISALDTPGSTAWRNDWDEDGAYLGGATLDSSLDLSPDYIRHVPGVLGSSYRIGGSLSISGDQNIFLLEIPTSGASTKGTRLGSPTFNGGVSLQEWLRLPDGSNLICGNDTVDAGSAGYLARFDSDLDFMSYEQLLGPPDEVGFVMDIALQGSGLVFAGYSTGSTVSWSTHQLSGQADISASWQDQDGVSSVLDWEAVDLDGEVTDLLPQVFVDSEDGESQSLVGYRALP
ncbi:hypothetical protein IT575_05315 [bacterium]|nr:hypothetical protein [bacterium]